MTDEEMYAQAIELVVKNNKPTISYVQRMLQIGYNKAATFIEKMEAAGIISAPNAEGKRTVLRKQITITEKFFELFQRDIQTARLELRVLDVTIKNAQIIWDVLQNENPDDFKYMWYSVSHKSHLPESVDETYALMKQDSEFKNGCVYYIFRENKFIGYMRIHYWGESKTLQCASVWFIKSEWGHGFNQEVHNKIEELAFQRLGVNRVCRQCMAWNIASKKSIESSGYHLDGIDRQSNRMPDGTFIDHLWYSKLASEYNAQKQAQD